MKTEAAHEDEAKRRLPARKRKELIERILEDKSATEFTRQFGVSMTAVYKHQKKLKAG